MFRRAALPGGGVGQKSGASLIRRFFFQSRDIWAPSRGQIIARIRMQASRHSCWVPTHCKSKTFRGVRCARLEMSKMSCRKPSPIDDLFSYKPRPGGGQISGGYEAEPVG